MQLNEVTKPITMPEPPSPPFSRALEPPDPLPVSGVAFVETVAESICKVILDDTLEEGAR